MGSLFDLAGRTALITGGTTGIGLAVAHALRDAGATVVVAGRDAARGAAAVQALHAYGDGPAAHFVAMDVADEASVAGGFEQALALTGRLHILINNAGINRRAPADQLALADWQAVIDTNLTGAFLCARAAHPHLRAAGGGKVLNIGSMMSVFGAAYAPAYGASKGGVVQLTQSLAVAWAADRIQVNAILPGWIDTDLTRAARAQVGGLHERVLARTPAGRWGEPSDLAGAAVFLSSRASDFVTGTVLRVDGGYSAMG
jgi:2-dehydro-3-deoxy-D-gluconate 5-dehydrogenase